MADNTSSEGGERDNIVKTYLKLVKKLQRLPTRADFHDEKITHAKIRHHFSSIERLHSFVDDNYFDDLHKLIAHESVVFSKQRLVGLNEDIKNKKKFFIITAVNGKKVDEAYYKSIKQWCKANDAALLVIPCADVASTRKNVSWTFDPLLKDEHFIHQETKLNEKFFISNIMVSAKQINPTTGLSRIGQRNGSYIFASPKQSLEYVATSASDHTHRLALMTPGAITKADYEGDKYMSKRTSYIAGSDHVMGGVIVEVQNRKLFHFRQVQANERGEFVDLGLRYFPDKKAQKVRTHFYMGDWHSGFTDKEVMLGFEKFCKDVEVQNLYASDFFDGYSISHHHINQPLRRVAKIKMGKGSLIKEIINGGADINWLHQKIKGSIYMIKGNHDEVMDRYLLEARYAQDDQNHYDALEFAKWYLDGEKVLQRAYEKYGDLKYPDRIVWLTRKDEIKVGGREVAQHGDKGANGTKGSMPSIEKAYGSAIVGHTHTPAILRQIIRVGTFSRMDMEYNDGPSSWVHCGAAFYDDGSAQLINFVNGDYTIR
jgi:hypothetical protein